MQNTLLCDHALHFVHGYIRSQWLICKDPACPCSIHHCNMVHREGRSGRRRRVQDFMDAPPEVQAALFGVLSSNGGIPRALAERHAQAAFKQMERMRKERVEELKRRPKPRPAVAMDTKMTRGMRPPDKPRPANPKHLRKKRERKGFA